MTSMLAPTPTLKSPAAVSVTADELYEMEDSVGYELVDGQLRHRIANEQSSRVGLRIGRLLANEAERTGTAYVYGADLGYQCFPLDAAVNIRKPDASVVLKPRRDVLLADLGYMPIPADLAVEVLSPNDLIRNVIDKVDEYLAAKFGVVWVFDPVRMTVVVYNQDGSIVKLNADATITGGAALPEFRCLVKGLIDS